MPIKACVVLDLTKVKSLPFNFGVNGEDYALVTAENISNRKFAKAEGELSSMTISNLPALKTCKPRKIRVTDKKRLSVPGKDGEYLAVCVVKR